MQRLIDAIASNLPSQLRRTRCCDGLCPCRIEMAELRRKLELLEIEFYNFQRDDSQLVRLPPVDLPQRSQNSPPPPPFSPRRRRRDTAGSSINFIFDFITQLGQGAFKKDYNHYFLLYRPRAFVFFHCRFYNCFSLSFKALSVVTEPAIASGDDGYDDDGDDLPLVAPLSPSRR